MSTHHSSAGFPLPLFTFSMSFRNCKVWQGREKNKLSKSVCVEGWKTPRKGGRKILVGSDQPRGTHHLLSTTCFMWGYWQCRIALTPGHFNHTELPRCWGWNPSFSFLCKAVAHVLAGEGSQIVLEKSISSSQKDHHPVRCHPLSDEQEILCTKPTHNRLKGTSVIKWPF